MRALATYVSFLSCASCALAVLAGLCACGRADTVVGVRASDAGTSSACEEGGTELLRGTQLLVDSARARSATDVAVLARQTGRRVQLELGPDGKARGPSRDLGDASVVNLPDVVPLARGTAVTFTNHVLRGRWAIFAADLASSAGVLDLGSAVEISPTDGSEKFRSRMTASASGFAIAYRNDRRVVLTRTDARHRPLGHTTLDACPTVPVIHAVVANGDGGHGVLHGCGDVQTLDLFSGTDGRHLGSPLTRMGRSAAIVRTATGSVVVTASSDGAGLILDALDANGSPTLGQPALVPQATAAVQVGAAWSPQGTGVLQVAADGTLRFALLGAAPPFAPVREQELGTAVTDAPPALLAQTDGFLAVFATFDEAALRSQRLCARP